MRWQPLVLPLAAGFLMGLAAVLGWIRGIEWPLWIAVWAGSALWIARGIRVLHFFHGFLAGASMSLGSSLLEIAFFPTFAANNPEAIQAAGDQPAGLSIRLFFVVISPILAVFSGVVVGLLTWGAGRLRRRP